MFISIVCIGIAAATADEDEEELEDGEEEEDSGRSILANTILALGVGFGGPLIISTQAYTIRRFSEFYSGLDQAIDAAPIQNLILCFFLIPLSDKMTITFKDIMIGTAAEGLMEAGRVLLAFGIEKGLAGPAQALMSTHALH